MNATTMTGRPARGTTSPPCPNSLRPALRAARTAPAVGAAPRPPIPEGARILGSVRVPLTLTTAPRAYLVVTGTGRPVWWVRLPAGDGTPQWRMLSRTEPLRWAWACRLPGLAREITRLLADLPRAEDA